MPQSTLFFDDEVFDEEWYSTNKDSQLFDNMVLKIWANWPRLPQTLTDYKTTAAKTSW